MGECLLVIHRSSHQRCARCVKKATRSRPPEAPAASSHQKQPPEAATRPANLLKKRPWHRCFPMNFAKFLRAPFLQKTSERLLRNKNSSKCYTTLRRNMGIKTCCTLTWKVFFVPNWALMFFYIPRRKLVLAAGSYFDS